MIVEYNALVGKCPECGEMAYSLATVIFKFGEKHGAGPIVMKCSKCGYYEKEAAEEAAWEMVEAKYKDPEMIRLRKFLDRHTYHDVRIETSRKSGIGTNMVVKCKTCKKKKDITDYEGW